MRHIERAANPAYLSQALVLTDVTDLRTQLSGALVENGLEVVSADGVEDVIRLSRVVPLPVTFVDLDMAEAVSDRFLDHGGHPPDGHGLVVLASEQSIPRLIEAVESGATAYLTKPLVPGEVRVVLGHVRRLRRQAAISPVGLYGASSEIQTIRKLIEQAAQSHSHVTVTGESGAGKRSIGRLIHESSERRGERFVQLSCVGFQQDVLGNLLFGAGTGEHSESGHLVACHRGTLLIDDIDLLHPDIQRRLFDFLRSQAAGVRVIAVSSRRLADVVRAEEFDSGLFELLRGVGIDVAPLRERKSDIPILADHFSRQAARASQKPSGGIEPVALAELMRYDWPGNVRELKDVLEQAVQSSHGGVVSTHDLPALPEAADTMGPGPRVPGATIHDIEKDAILRTLEATGGSTSKAARILEMSVRKIQYKLKEYRVEAASIAAVESMPSVARPKASPVRGDTAIAARR